MTEPWTSSQVGEAVYRARVRGCLLGGAPAGTPCCRPFDHSSDGDSTGSICGNLLGARHGGRGLPHEWRRSPRSPTIRRPKVFAADPPGTP